MLIGGCKLKLLIIDDEETVREGLKKLPWDTIGITSIETAEDGYTALEIVATQHPHIILTDIRMPGINGLQLAEEITKQNIDGEMIVLSGYGTFEYARRAMRNGVFDFLLKPSSPAEILNTVSRAVERVKYNQSKKAQKEVKNFSEHLYDNAEKKTCAMTLEYIENNYMDDITLSSLSESMHFSISYLSRLIKKETSYNFTTILLLTRMIKAAELLKKTDLKIYSICEKIGVNDQRYFSQQFKKIFNKTPMEYRKSELDNNEWNLMKFIKKMRENDD